MIIAADKTRNFYKAEKEEYLNFLRNNITANHKIAAKSVIENITKKDKEISEKLDISDRVYVTAKQDAYITLKDHKDIYMNNPKFRLINTSKSEIGMVSKKMLAQIVQVVREKSQLLQWKNTDSVIAWFKGLKDKNRLQFIQFDVVDFYGSISEELLENSITYAAKFTDIDEITKSTIKQAAQSFLCSENKFWITKSGTFNVTMGGYHGAEICELTGLFLLSQLCAIMPKQFIGLYRDDGLAVSSARPRQLELIKKKICKVFADNKLRVTIEANVKIVNFLDVTLDLSTGIYKPYMKENDMPVYVNKQSNHPPKVLKNIPLGINERLSRISANEEEFRKAAPPYQEALRKSGFNHQLEFKPPEPQLTKKRRRKKEVIWFNPPFSCNVKTNVGKEFLKLVDRSFPEGNPLRKVFNRNTVKIGYKCMPNMAMAIKRHNNRILNQEVNVGGRTACKCDGGAQNCPVDGHCKDKWVVYSAKVTENSSGQSETYTGLTSRTFMTRRKEHLRDFEDPDSRVSSKLSGHIWDLKDKGLSYTLNWSILDRAPPFNTTKRKCMLCLTEKYHIMYDREHSSLNKRSEVFNTCRHRTQGLLCNYKNN